MRYSSLDLSENMPISQTKEAKVPQLGAQKKSDSKAGILTCYMKYLQLNRENTLHWGSGGKCITARDQGPETQSQCGMGKPGEDQEIRVSVSYHIRLLLASRSL